MSTIKYTDSDGSIKYLAGRGSGNDPSDPFRPEQIILQEGLASAANQITTHQYLSDIRNKDFATQATLSQVSERINRITKIGSVITQNLVISSTASIYNYGASIDLVEFNSVGLQAQVVTASTNNVNVALRVQFSADGLLFNNLPSIDEQNVLSVKTYVLGALNVLGPIPAAVLTLPRSLRYVRFGLAALAAPGSVTGVVQLIIQGLNN